MSTTDATTDGFRVGRRVRVSNPRDEWHGDQGEIIPWRIGDNPTTGFHRIQMDTGGVIARHLLDLMPVDDDEPDATATPEPERPSLKEGFQKLREAAGDRWAGVDAREYVKAMRGDDEPAPADDPAKDHYAILRERGHEPWDVMQASFPADWCLAYNVLTAFVYLQRCTLKHPTPDDDIRKAHAHLGEAVAILDGRTG